MSPSGRPRVRPFDLLWVAAAGALHAWSLSPWCAALFDAAPAALQTCALLALLWQLSGGVGLSPRRAAVSTWLYGSVWLIGATGWMYVSLHRYGGLPGWLAALAVLLLCMALSLYMGLTGWLWARWRSAVWWRDALLFGALWLLAEMARAVIFTGFPWGASGYGMLGSPLEWLAPWLGVYGVGAVWATSVAAILLAWRSGAVSMAARLGVVAAMASCLVLMARMPVPSFTQPHGGALDVTLLQGNVPQDEKFVPELQVPMLLWHARQLVQAQGRLVVAPETAIPLLPFQLPRNYWDQLLAAFGPGSGRYALFGVPLGDFEKGYTNSVAGLSAEALAQPGGFYRYNKHHLVPFGEFIPWGFRWFVDMMNMPLGDFTRGPVAAPPFKVGVQRIGPNICYEDLYGEELAARFADARQAPTILANVSNLAWFGEEVAIQQHLRIARLRSLEFQLPTLRATNTGATVVIDHQGRVTHALPFNTQGVLQATVQGREGVTPFAWWAARWHLWPLLVLAAMGVLPALFGRRGAIH
ncbi:MAG: apolipoprotein N-acyltransferase [Aquabacterium sp.]